MILASAVAYIGMSFSEKKCFRKHSNIFDKQVTILYATLYLFV